MVDESLGVNENELNNVNNGGVADGAPESPSEISPGGNDTLPDTGELQAKILLTENKLATLTENFSVLSVAINNLTNALDQKFIDINARFDSLVENIDILRSAFTQQAEKISVLQTHVSLIEDRGAAIGALPARVEYLEQNLLQAQNGTLAAFLEEMERKLSSVESGALENKVNELTARFEKLISENYRLKDY